jgi:hypothetical protein
MVLSVPGKVLYGVLLERIKEEVDPKLLRSAGGLPQEQILHRPAFTSSRSNL